MTASAKRPQFTNTTVANAKPGKASYKISDRDGLYLLVTPAGGKLWRYDYRFGGKRKTLALGIYPDVLLAIARQRLSVARTNVAAGIDPAVIRAEEKQALVAQAAALITFSEVGEEWRARKSSTWSEATARKATEGLALLGDQIGRVPIVDLKTAQAVEALHAIEKRSKHMARKCRQYVGQVVRYAIRTGKRAEGQFLDLNDVLAPLPESHFPSPVNENGHRLPELLIAVDKYTNFNSVVGQAIKLLMLTFVRPGEMVGMRWSEIVGNEWKYKVTKVGSDHIVPLSSQALKILSDMRKITGEKEFVFASVVASEGHISRDSLSKALRSMGFSRVAVPHGMRSLASTTLNEHGFNSDVIERQLTHKEKNAVRAAYNRARYMDERVKMMQWWADYLEKLKKGVEDQPERPSMAQAFADSWDKVNEHRQRQKLIG